MTLQEVSSHFAYNHWANDRTFSAAAGLTTDQLNRPLGSSFSSIRDTLAHLVAGEWVWLQRWLGVSPTAFPEWQPASDLPALVARFAQIDADRAAFLATLTDDDLVQPVAFRLLSGQQDVLPLIAQMLHIVNHSTYHRGQVAGMMRQVGGTPVSTDLIAYARLRIGNR